MKYLYLILFTLLSTFAFSQVPTTLSGKLQIYAVSGSSPNYSIQAFFSDDLSYYSADSVSTGDKVYVLEGSECWELTITSISTNTGSLLNCVVRDSTGLLSGVSLGQAAIMTHTPTRNMPVYISTLRDDLRSCIMNRFALKADSITSGSSVGIDSLTISNDTLFHTRNSGDVDIIPLSVSATATFDTAWVSVTGDTLYVAESDGDTTLYHPNTDGNGIYTVDNDSTTIAVRTILIDSVLYLYNRDQDNWLRSINFDSQNRLYASTTYNQNDTTISSGFTLRPDYAGLSYINFRTVPGFNFKNSELKLAENNSSLYRNGVLGFNIIDSTNRQYWDYGGTYFGLTHDTILYSGTSAGNIYRTHGLIVGSDEHDKWVASHPTSNGTWVWQNTRNSSTDYTGGWVNINTFEDGNGIFDASNDNDTIRVNIIYTDSTGYSIAKIGFGDGIQAVETFGKDSWQYQIYDLDGTPVVGSSIYAGLNSAVLNYTVASSHGETLLLDSLGFELGNSNAGVEAVHREYFVYLTSDKDPTIALVPKKLGLLKDTIYFDGAGADSVYFKGGIIAQVDTNNKFAVIHPPTNGDWFWQQSRTGTTLGGQWVNRDSLGGVGGGTDNQVIDTFDIATNILRISLEDDGEAAKTVDLSSYLDNTDNQNLTLSNDTLYIEDGNFVILSDSLLKSSDTLFYTRVSGAIDTIVLASFVDTDVQVASEVPVTPTGNLTSTDAQAALEELQSDIDAISDTDDQTIDEFQIVSDILSISLESDAEAPKTVDLSPYLDNTDAQVLDTFELVGNTLRSSLSNDGEPAKTVDLSGYLDDTVLSQEQVEDYVGGMWDSGSNDGASYSYDDVNGKVIITVSAGTSNIQDDAITLAKIGQNGATDGQVMVWDNGLGQWVVEDQAGGGGTDDQTLGLDSTALTIESGNTVFLDTLLDRTVSQANSFSSAFNDNFARVYYSSMDYDEINTVPADRMTIDSIDTTNDFFKVSWDGFDTILYNIEVRDTFKWLINVGNTNKTGTLDSIDLVNHRFYYTVFNGSEFALNDTVEIYNIFASYEFLSTTGTTEKILNAGITNSVTTIGGNTVYWHGTGATMKKKNGSLVNMIHVEYSSGETGERDIILATSDDMVTWEWDGTVWRDNDEVGWMTATDILLTDVDKIPTGQYAGKYICTGSILGASEEDPFYFIIDEDLDTIVGFRERIINGYTSTNKLRPFSVEYHQNQWHEIYLEADAANSHDRLMFHAIYNTLQDYMEGNYSYLDTIISGSLSTYYGFDNGYFDAGTLHSENGELALLYGIQPGLTGGVPRLYTSNRSYGIMNWNGTTWDIDPAGPRMTAPIGYSDIDDNYKNLNDHLGGYPNIVEWGDNLHIFLTAKGNNFTTEYYKPVIAKFWDKNKDEYVTTWDIKDETIQLEDLSLTLQNQLGGLQGTRQTFAPTTTMTWDLNTKISGSAIVDCTSITSGVTLTVSNPNTTYPSYYTLYFHSVSGTDGITFPTGWIDESGTALGTVNISADTYFACEYIGISGSKLYMCK